MIGFKLKNSMVKTHAFMTGADARLLADRLLWLRNHYDVGKKEPEIKRKVLADIDAVLKHVGVGIA